MRQFRCSHCGQVVSARGEPGDDALCLNCNTLQQVPADATVVPRLEPASQQTIVASRLDACPEFVAAELVGLLLVIFGIIGILLTLLMALQAGPVALVTATGGLLLIAAGLIVRLLRHIAIDVWHIRHD